jgi:hypothetical protein
MGGVGYLLDPGGSQFVSIRGAGALDRLEAPASAAGSGTGRFAQSRGTAPTKPLQRRLPE